MKKILALSVFLFICVSAVFAIHPLIGNWKFSEVIGGVRFYDYVTITAINTTTKRVAGYLTGLSSYKVTGYYNGNIVYIEDSFADYYLDGYYFTFQGTTPFKRHLGICSIFHDFDASWHGLTATKLSSSNPCSSLSITNWEGFATYYHVETSINQSQYDLKNVGITVTLYDKNNNIIDSGVGTISTIPRGSSGKIDVVLQYGKGLYTDHSNISITACSFSPASPEIMTLSDVLNQKALKRQAQLRESMTARTLPE